MTEQELEILRQKARVTAANALMVWLAGQLLSLGQQIAPDPQIQRKWAEGWHQALQEKRAEYTQIVFPEHPPEKSDLYAAELQEAFDEAAKKVEAILCRQIVGS